MLDIHAEALAETAKLAGKYGVSQHMLDITDRNKVEELSEQVVAEHK